MIDDYITTYFSMGMQNKSGNIPIKDVTNMPLCTIIFTISWVSVALVPTMLPKHI